MLHLQCVFHGIRFKVNYRLVVGRQSIFFIIRQLARFDDKKNAEILIAKTSAHGKF